MKDWYIRPNKYGKKYKPFLIHIPCMDAACKQRGEKWYCLDCGAIAPEEIEFIAELAHCWGMYPTSEFPP